MEDWDTLPLHRYDGSIIPLAEVVEATIDHAVVICLGDVSLAAKLLGVGRATIYRRRRDIEASTASSHVQPE
ncbi:MAG: hypothetical protein EON93_16955 [Burkholderiales bacterium]|nr:MAG: hypothetical protein EON93_16955 [Burkholderiales bacterium]